MKAEDSNFAMAPFFVIFTLLVCTMLHTALKQAGEELKESQRRKLNRKRGNDVSD